MGQACKAVLRDLKELFPCRDVFGSHVEGVRKGIPDKGGKAVGLGHTFKIFVSKTKNERMVGNGSRAILGFLRGGMAVGHLVSSSGGGWRKGSVIRSGPEVTGRHVFFLKGNDNIVNRMWVFEIIYAR